MTPELSDYEPELNKFMGNRKMTKPERLEYRRKFLLRVAQFLLSETRYDDMSLELPSVTPNSDTVITVILRGKIAYTQVSWDLTEITYNLSEEYRSRLILTRIEDAIFAMDDMIKEKLNAESTPDTSPASTEADCPENSGPEISRWSQGPDGPF